MQSFLTLLGNKSSISMKYNSISMTTLENQTELIETFDKKQSRLEGFMELSDTWKSGFKDIAPELTRWDGNFDQNDIKLAAQRRIDVLIASKLISVGNLSREEQDKIRQIQIEIMKCMDGKSPKDMVEEYGKIREKLVGTLSASDGKFQSTNKATQFKQEWEQIAIREKKEDWTDSMEQLRNEIQRITDKRSKDKLKQQQRLAQAWEEERRIASVKQESEFRFEYPQSLS